jgi:hypothetical protein
MTGGKLGSRSGRITRTLPHFPPCARGMDPLTSTTERNVYPPCIHIIISLKQTSQRRGKTIEQSLSIRMSRVPSSSIYGKKAMPAVRIADLFKANNLKKLPPGRYSDVILSSGLPCRVGHYPDDTWWVEIAGRYRYQLVPRFIPVSSRHLIWIKAEQQYRLPYGQEPPTSFYALDALGKRVSTLFVLDNGTIPAPFGSRHELKIYYRCNNRAKPAAREQRRIDRLFMKYPDRKTDVMNPKNSIPKLMSLRPWNLLKRKWMRLILKARYNLKGQELETQTTRQLESYHTRPANRSRNRPQYAYTLGPMNWAAHQDKVWRDEHSEPPPLPLHSGSWQ